MVLQYVVWFASRLFEVAGSNLCANINASDPRSGTPPSMVITVNKPGSRRRQKSEGNDGPAGRATSWW